MFKIGCHVSIAGGVCNAPKNARDLACETFQIFTRPPQGGKAIELHDLMIERFKDELRKYYPSPRPSPARGEGAIDFVVHTPYYINFGSSNPRIYHGSINVVREELERSSLLGARFLMTHLGSFKDLGAKKGMAQVKKGLKEVLEGFEGNTQFLIEIAAGSGEIIGDTFEELAGIIESIEKYKTFGGICFDTQHAWASGYDISKPDEVLGKFDEIIGLKWLKMSHINDSKVDLGSNKDRHEHIGEGKIGKKGLGEFIKYLKNLTPRPLSLGGEGESDNVAFGSFPLILETKPDKVKEDIKILKSLRDKI